MNLFDTKGKKKIKNKLFYFFSQIFFLRGCGLKKQFFSFTGQCKSGQHNYTLSPQAGISRSLSVFRLMIIFGQCLKSVDDYYLYKKTS
jgi:hypothetical protein